MSCFSPWSCSSAARAAADQTSDSLFLKRFPVMNTPAPNQAVARMLTRRLTDWFLTQSLRHIVLTDHLPGDSPKVSLLVWHELQLP